MCKRRSGNPAHAYILVLCATILLLLAAASADRARAAEATVDELRDAVTTTWGKMAAIHKDYLNAANAISEAAQGNNTSTKQVLGYIRRLRAENSADRQDILAWADAHTNSGDWSPFGKDVQNAVLAYASGLEKYFQPLPEFQGTWFSDLERLYSEADAKGVSPLEARSGTITNAPQFLATAGAEMERRYRQVAGAQQALVSLLGPPHPKNMDPIQIVAVSFGGFLILLLLALVFWRRNLTDEEYTFARIVLALALACLAVLITGFLNVQYQGYIQAGGGFAVFVIVYFMTPAALQGTSEWQTLRGLWRDLRDINNDPAQANADDVARAVKAVNETARLIENDDSLFRPFEKDYKEDYCPLYSKLARHHYPIPHANTTSDTVLTPAASKLAKRLACPA